MQKVETINKNFPNKKIQAYNEKLFNACILLNIKHIHNSRCLFFSYRRCQAGNTIVVRPEFEQLLLKNLYALPGVSQGFCSTCIAGENEKATRWGGFWIDDPLIRWLVPGRL